MIFKIYENNEDIFVIFVRVLIYFRFRMKILFLSHLFFIVVSQIGKFIFKLKK
jgi:hypothetical protein